MGLIPLSLQCNHVRFTPLSVYKGRWPYGYDPKEERFPLTSVALIQALDVMNRRENMNVH